LKGIFATFATDSRIVKTASQNSSPEARENAYRKASREQSSPSALTFLARF
jgi:hypothetical protein